MPRGTYRPTPSRAAADSEQHHNHNDPVSLTSLCLSLPTLLQIVCDIVKAYGSSGRSIIFVDTKNDAAELSQQVTRDPCSIDVEEGAAAAVHDRRCSSSSLSSSSSSSWVGCCCLLQVGETIGARALHGDIPQGQRETTLAGFRGGKFMVLVATDVAARGLDISGVELVVQTEPPKVDGRAPPPPPPPPPRPPRITTP